MSAKRPTPCVCMWRPSNLHTRSTTGQPAATSCPSHQQQASCHQFTGFTLASASSHHQFRQPGVPRSSAALRQQHERVYAAGDQQEQPQAIGRRALRNHQSRYPLSLWQLMQHRPELSVLTSLIEVRSSYLSCRVMYIQQRQVLVEDVDKDFQTCLTCTYIHT